MAVADPVKEGETGSDATRAPLQEVKIDVLRKRLAELKALKAKRVQASVIDASRESMASTGIPPPSEPGGGWCI